MRQPRPPTTASHPPLRSSRTAVPVDSEVRRAAVAAARTSGDMWAALGTDAWVVVPIRSTTRPGHDLEGTRLTVVNLSKGPGAAAAAAEDGTPPARCARVAPALQQAGHSDGSGSGGVRVGGGSSSAARAAAAQAARPQPDAYEFSIRTPVTPARWDDYDQARRGGGGGKEAAESGSRAWGQGVVRPPGRSPALP